MDIRKLVDAIVFKSSGKTAQAKAKLKRADLGILKVALMVAALDGTVLPTEYEAFGLLAKKGMGYGDAAALQALKEAMRSAGYIMMVAAKAAPEELVAEFLSEAKSALPSGFAYLLIEDIRQAFVAWIAMAISDGDYSDRERACIEALRMHFAELKANRIELENEYWRSISPNIRSIVEEYPGSRLKLASKDFTAKVATLVRQFGNTADARRKLTSLIVKGE